MTLLSLLIAMALERLLVPAKRWQLSSYLAPYFNLLKRWDVTSNWFRQMWGQLLIALLPALGIWLLLGWLEGALFGLLSLLIYSAILLLAMGCVTARKQYKTFLRAACRGDEEACFLVAQKLGAATCTKEGETDHQSLEEGVGQTLTWINYRYYIAVMIWLILFGIEGVLFYATLRALVEQASVEADAEFEKEPEESQLESIHRLMRWLDFIPVRMASLGLTLVGNFSKAMPIWLEHLLNVNDAPKTHLVRVSLAAEEIDNPDNPTCIASVTQFVDMAKRNVMLMLSLIAILTLYGSLS